MPSVSHIPGHLNVLADSLGRFKQPLLVELTTTDFWEVNGRGCLRRLQSKLRRLAESGPNLVALNQKKCVAAVCRLVSRNRFLSLGSSYSGWSIFDSVLVLLNSPPLSINQFTTPAFWVCISWLCLGYHLICMMSVHNSGPLVFHTSNLYSHESDRLHHA